MKATVDVKDRDERSAVVRAMTDPETRAHVIVMGHLLALPDDAARSRVLRMLQILVEPRNTWPMGRPLPQVGRLHDGADPGE